MRSEERQHLQEVGRAVSPSFVASTGLADRRRVASASSWRLRLLTPHPSLLTGHCSSLLTPHSSRFSMTFASIEDLRQAARRRLPRAIFDFIDGGAQDEVTLRHNLEDFRRLSLLPRVLTDVASREQSVTVLGQRFDSPLILAPTGLPGVVWPNGAMEAALAADRAGVGFCLSTMSTSSIEEIAKASTRPVWFQLYVMRDRELAKSMMQRAKAAGCSVAGDHRRSADAGAARPRRAQRAHHSAPVQAGECDRLRAASGLGLAFPDRSEGHAGQLRRHRQGRRHVHHRRASSTRSSTSR